METILVIDDEPSLRQSLRLVLQGRGFVALEAATCREGIGAATAQTPDLIVCDVKLPDGAGYGVFEALKENPATSAIPFIYMTGVDDPAVLRRGMEQGADDFLLKPFDAESLLAAVGARLRRGAMLRAHAEQTEKRLQAIVEAAPTLVAMADVQTRHILYLNRAGRHILQFGEKERVTHFLGVKEDITQRKAAEQQRAQMQLQLQQAQKLESIGQLAAGIAHEINTPTQFIGDNLHFMEGAFNDLLNLLREFNGLLERARSQSFAPETVAEIQKTVESINLADLEKETPQAIAQALSGVQRVAKIVQAMKDFSHPGTETKIPVDLNRAIESTLTVCRNEWKYVAELETEFDPALPTVSCLPGEFNQVILNIVVNAAHAIADQMGGNGKGTIKVSTRRQSDGVEIRISDTGTGIPEAVRGRIFDPFFTTKEVGKGTGQGLAIARSVVVDKHQGEIHFETEMGKGTTFIIRLPQSEARNGQRAGPR